jgi:hypothetical protein
LEPRRRRVTRRSCGHCRNYPSAKIIRMRRWHLGLPNQRPTATHVRPIDGIPPSITFDSTTLANALVSLP